jgi:hypothetical protein
VHKKTKYFKSLIKVVVRASWWCTWEVVLGS